MKYTQGFLGKVFIARLDDGESIEEVVESICIREGLRNAIVFLMGGLRDENREGKLLGTGIVLQKNKKHNFSFHASMGSKDGSFVGQSDPTIQADQIVEAIVIELGGIDAIRAFDEKLGTDVLTIVGAGSDGKEETQMKGAFGGSQYSKK